MIRLPAIIAQVMREHDAVHGEGAAFKELRACLLLVAFVVWTFVAACAIALEYQP